MPLKWPRSDKTHSKAASESEQVVGFPCGLQLLYAPENDPVVDIIFIHGLTGDWTRTWSTTDGKVLWPRDLLPTKLPGARVFTFGYDAYVIHKKIGSEGRVGQYRIRNHAVDLLNAIAAERPETTRWPIIFVAHSLGGLVCKDALVVSKTDPSRHLKSICEYTNGIAFMGTPHLGSSLASWASLPAKALGVMKSTNKDLLSLLEITSEVLERIHNDFLRMLKDRDLQSKPLEVTCFYESLPLPYGPTVVKEQSATIPGCNSVSIHGDHREMTKFGTSDNPGFLSVVAELARWTRSIPTELEEKIALSDADRKCLQSLYFPELQAREFMIDRAAVSTCEWIKSIPKYLDWKHGQKLDGSHGLLWIKGNPGSGKSTLMKHIYREQSEVKVGSNLSLAFFFNARGSPMEKSSLGLYRSLLYQLLRTRKEHLKDLTSMFDLKTPDAGGAIDWSLSELNDFFHSAITKADSRPLTIYIDALDECGDEDEVRRFIAAFETSAAYAMRIDRTLKICWSSRHYPHISIRHGFEFRMEEHNVPDIVRYVKQQLQPSQQALLGEDLISEIIRKASGVFLWTVLVVQKVTKAADQGKSPKEIQGLVSSSPSELGLLFKQILESVNVVDRETSIHLFQWIILAFEKLDWETVRLALAFSEPQPPQSAAALENRELMHMNRENFSLYLTRISAGLVQIVEEDVVQVMHESVRDFFLTGKGYEITTFGCREAWIQGGHDMIWQTCANYISLPEHHLNLIPEDDPEEGEQVVELLESDKERKIKELKVVKALNPLFSSLPNILACSFIDYVVSSMFLHAEKTSWLDIEGAQQNCFRKRYLLQSLAWSYPHLEFLLPNKIKEVLSGKCRNLFHARLGHLLELDVELPQSLRSDALVAAVHIRSASLITRELDRGLDINGVNMLGDNALGEAARQGFTDVVGLLLDREADIEVKYKGGRTALCEAIRTGNMEMVDLLLKHGADVRGRNTEGWTSMHWAGGCGSPAIFMRLIEKGGDINVRDDLGSTPLHLAALMANDAVIPLLIKLGADVSLEDDTKCNAVMAAIAYGRESTLKLLIEHGVDVNLMNSERITCVMRAATHGQASIVQTLIELGADIHLKDIWSYTALLRALLMRKAPIMTFICLHATNPAVVLEWASNLEMEESEYAALILFDNQGEHDDLEDFKADSLNYCLFNLSDSGLEDGDAEMGRESLEEEYDASERGWDSLEEENDASGKGQGLEEEKDALEERRDSIDEGNEALETKKSFVRRSWRKFLSKK